MTGRYYTEAADVLRAAGLVVVECDGWKTRARSSGGFAATPVGIQWHHTASSTTPENDTAWQCTGSDDAPIGNATIMRDGSVWLVAAGGANTAGQGGPLTMPSGVTIPADGANSRTWAWEVANDGVGEPWPAVQIDAYFTATLAMCALFQIRPDDVFTHAYGSSECRGWTDRKIDPATAAAVAGPWRPRSVNSSGTWHLADIRAELNARAGQPTPPPPDPEPTPEPTPPDEGDDMAAIMPTIRRGDRGAYVERMQHLLAAAGYMNPANPANYDGVWGDGTDGAKARFDNDHGLTPSPPTDCGARSWESLLTGRTWET